MGEVKTGLDRKSVSSANVPASSFNSTSADFNRRQIRAEPANYEEAVTELASTAKVTQPQARFLATRFLAAMSNASSYTLWGKDLPISYNKHDSIKVSSDERGINLELHQTSTNKVFSIALSDLQHLSSGTLRIFNKGQDGRMAELTSGKWTIPQGFNK